MQGDGRENTVTFSTGTKIVSWSGRYTVEWLSSWNERQSGKTQHYKGEI